MPRNFSEDTVTHSQSSPNQSATSFHRVGSSSSQDKDNSTLRAFTLLCSSYRHWKSVPPYITAATCGFSKFAFRPCMITASTQKASVSHLLAWRRQSATSTLSLRRLSAWSSKLLCRWNRRILRNCIQALVARIVVVVLAGSPWPRLITCKASLKLRSSISSFLRVTGLRLSHTNWPRSAYERLKKSPIL